MSQFFNAMRREMNYMLSLPERSVRSLAALVGGTTSLLTDTLFPEALRGTTLYRLFVGDMQRFMIEKVAQVQQEQAAQAAQATPAASDDPHYVPKKMVGSAIETAGLLTMHFSPLWVFAIAGDAAAGSGVFLNRLVEQLKANGVIAGDVQVGGLTDLLNAVQDATCRSVSAIDTPPLSQEEIAKLASDLTQTYGQMFSRVNDLLPRFETIWEKMKQVAQQQNATLEQLEGVLTIDVAEWGRKSIGAVFAVGQTGAGLFGEQFLDSYARTLDVVSQEGLTGYLNRRMLPFLSAAAAHFNRERKTWTQLLAERVWGSGSGAGSDEA